MAMEKLKRGEEFLYLNDKECGLTGLTVDIGMEDIKEASARLSRFAPFIAKVFPETTAAAGIIESELMAIPEMKVALTNAYGEVAPGTLLLKMDSHLPIAGSIKARGGIYEVLKHAEEIALERGLIHPGDHYEKLAEAEARELFSKYKIQVGSTGNLGLSIGIASAAVGFKVIVHMSADARQWKKDLLRSHGVEVIEYQDDYSKAVEEGRKLSDEDPTSYFIDDENSKDLFMGYAVAALRLGTQLEEQKIKVDGEHPLFVYLPCGVGGAPGGITFGLKEIFGEHVHCFFIEPVAAPCMTLGMASGLHNEISVKDIGLSGQTHADGLAVGRASGFVGKVMEPLLAGCFTMADGSLYDYMRLLLSSEEVFIEPSAAASFEGVVKFCKYPEMKTYLQKHNLEDKMDNASHIAWATGGVLVPAEIQEEYIRTVV